MSNVKGVVSPQGEVLMAKLLDERAKWKSPIMETLDNKMFLIVIRAIDNNLLDKIPEEWQNPLEPIIEEALQGNWESAGELISKLINDKLDLPWLDEDSELLLFSSIINLVLGLIMSKVEDVRNSK